jgi:hypothetical protein
MQRQIFVSCINAEKIWVKDSDTRIETYYFADTRVVNSYFFLTTTMYHSFPHNDNDFILSIVKVLIAKHLDASDTFDMQRQIFVSCINAENVWVKDSDARIAVYRCLLATRYVVDSRL